MKEKGLVVRMRGYMEQLRQEKRYSSAKSYQDALNSFIRYSGTERISYSAINKDSLRIFKRKKALPQEEMCRLMTARVGSLELRKTHITLCLMFLYGGMAFVDFAHLKGIISRMASWITIVRRRGRRCGSRCWLWRGRCQRSWLVIY